MKKTQKAIREFEKLKTQLRQTEFIVKNSKDSNLWDHEAIVRKKIKALTNLRDKQLFGFDVVYDGYLQLLDTISARLLRYYNKRKGTAYQFEEIVEEDRDGYISSGIISLLVTKHIPKLIAVEFTKYFPENPKDDYEQARSITRKFVLHLGDTNTGKTYQAIQRLKLSKKGIYLAPLRILALENYEKLNKDGIPCNLITGEEEILVDGANHVCSTIEKLNFEKEYDVAVIDEIQMISNDQRGQAWTRALLGLRCVEIHVCGAINAKELIIKMLDDCGDFYEIYEYVRETPLEVISEPVSINHITKGDALVAFSKRQVLELSRYFLDRGIKNSVIYGDLPPDVRRMQYHSFITGVSRILITTDAIGMGVNLPIRRIIFTSLIKFDGEEKRYLTSQEIKQIAGRAGRKGIYNIGYVGVTNLDYLFIKESLEMEDEPLDQAVLGPSEAITRIAGLPLKEKLALWSTNHHTLEYYKKMDIRDYLLILENIKYYKLTDDVAFKLMNLPFDGRDEEIMKCFLDFVDTYFGRKQGIISKPKAPGNRLIDLEKYYQKLNLYYSFSKNFNLEFDPGWVYQEREIISIKINHLLLKL